jgi:ubiquinone/menaquinone biosynthesis C-methylase UbiE
MTGDDWLADTRAGYDADAESYTEKVRDLLTRLPFHRAALSLFADAVRAAGGGPVADIGCGPGYVTAHLATLGVEAFGVDLSPAMIRLARQDHPNLRFEVGSMTDLRMPDASLSGLLAWWSLIHIPDADVSGVLRGFHRVVRPGGPLQIGFHTGDASDPDKIHSYHRPLERVANWLREAGFAIEAQLAIDPDGGRPGAILFARRP